MAAPPNAPSPAEVSEAFGKVLRTLRLDRALSQESLGLAAGSGRTYISELERGQKTATVAMLFRLAHTLGVAPSDIVAHVEHHIASVR